MPLQFKVKASECDIKLRIAYFTKSWRDFAWIPRSWLTFNHNPSRNNGWRTNFLKCLSSLRAFSYSSMASAVSNGRKAAALDCGAWGVMQIKSSKCSIIRFWMASICSMPAVLVCYAGETELTKYLFSRRFTEAYWLLRAARFTYMVNIDETNLEGCDKQLLSSVEFVLEVELGK